MILSDTPGILNRQCRIDDEFCKSAFEDADILIYGRNRRTRLESVF
jgi:hypothetical protein